jgi:hypothetical protein
MPSTCVYSFCLVLAILSVSNNSFAQVGKSRIIKYDTTARPGKVVLIDGSEIKGNIVFNDNDGIVIVHVNDNDTKSFNAKRLLGFQFYASDLGRLRRFYCIEFADEETGVKNAEIFEVLKEFQAFAVLSKIGRLKSVTPFNVMGQRQPKTTTDRKDLKMEQTETVYFVNSDGLFEAYLEFKTKEKEGDVLDTHGKSSRFIEVDLFGKYTAQHYPAVGKYADENKLSFKSKEDLIKILDEYERLISAR